jgi:hypothetical protein
MTVRSLTLTLAGLSLVFATAQSTIATEIRVKIENLQPTDGFFFTPVWLGFHDGGFDLYDVGSAAGVELEAIAEQGNPGPLSTLFQSVTNSDGTARYDATITSPGGFADAPVFDPGETVTIDLSVPDAASNRYLSIASMVIPSNDAFFGNGDPAAHQVFSVSGNLLGPLTIEIFGADIYDSGTEVNDTMGAAFSIVGGTAIDESGVVGLHTGLDNFVGTGTAAGTTIGSHVGSTELLARVTVSQVPEPSTSALLGSAVLGAILLAWRRRQ